MAEPSQPRHSPRIATLDALRGLAVLIVMGFHMVTSSQFGEAKRFALLFTVIDLAHLGVCLFFIISGYVIALTLDRSALHVFWWRRFLRLYPCYWLSIALVLVVSVTGRASPFTPQFQTMPGWLVLANMTMLQSLFGFDNLLGVYWSLLYELVFYAAMSMLAVFGLAKRSVGIALLVLLLAFINDGAIGGLAGAIPCAVSLFGLMTIGNVLYRVAEGRVDQRWGIIVPAGYCLLFGLLPVPPALMLARWGAIVLFILLMRVQWQPRLMVWLGLISYPLYLIHEIVIAVITTPNTVLTLLAWVAGSVLFAWMIHHALEQPLLRFGRRR